jgi:hypothetical protein
VLQGFSGQSRSQGRAQPVNESLGINRLDPRPIDKNEREWPRRQNPPNGSTHADNPEFLLRILHMGKRNRISDGNRWDVEQAVHKHQRKKRPKRSRPGERQDGNATDQVTDGEKTFRGEIPIRKLIAKEHPNDRGNRESIEDPGLFDGAESKARQITEDQWQPGAPNEELQNHHQEKLEANGFIHSYGRTVKECPKDGKGELNADAE